jgi:uncharacterized membrane protein YvbJ
MKYCPNCGKEITENQNFCDNCGYDLINLRKRKTSKTIFLIPLLIILVLLAGAYYYFYIYSNTPSQVVKNFISLLNRGEVIKAINLYMIKTNDFEMPNEDEIKTFKGSILSYEIVREKIIGDEAYLEVMVDSRDRGKNTSYIKLIKINGKWMIYPEDMESFPE